ncbi:exodeoxyribonuclease VII small subunit [Butyrivibrio sp. XPD2006]|uniref:exodeoxyribonuclease VII small subunit n=1 Tax=Butyrivibrio sp. XPD2006 TaxID=1280668 RepID=UPI0003B783CE|nr:exodeoxyribonuclease VII small subunit [Butyrivibrio sp. XPD2006]
MAAKKKEEKMTIEEAFAAIDEKIKALEDEDISLEESFAQYKEGMELLKLCHESIESVEQKVKEIAEDGSLEDFE